MAVAILPYNAELQCTHSEGRLHTLGANPVLPGIIADVFGWEALCIEYTDLQGDKLLFGACRKGRSIVLLPHFSYGPAVAKAAAAEILAGLKTLGYKTEWRLPEKVSEYCYAEKVSSILPLEADEEKQFSALSSNVRRKIRKCEANGLVTVSGGPELLDVFYALYSRSMHRLGSPALPRRWFGQLLAGYRHGDAGIWITYSGEKPVGAALMLEYRGFSEACWVASDPAYLSFYSTYGLYWAMIRYAAEQCGSSFSFGRSTRGSGVHVFKQQWGATDMPLFWNYSQPQGKNIRHFTLFSKAWKALPFFVAKRLGPFFAGRIY